MSCEIRLVLKMMLFFLMNNEEEEKTPPEQNKADCTLFINWFQFLSGVCFITEGSVIIMMSMQYRQHETISA